MTAGARGRVHDEDAVDRLFAGPGEMRARCRTFDWAASPLGPAQFWPGSLRTAASIVLGSAFPMILVWGPERVQLYNDAYIPLIGRKHPRALGIPTHECWPEIRNIQEPIFTRVFRGETVHLTEARYVLDRSGTGVLEEAYFDATFAPVPLEGGEVGGSFSTLLESTHRRRVRAAEADSARLLAELTTEREGLRSIVLSTPAPLALLVGPEHRFELVNTAYRRVSGGGRDVSGLTPRQAFPEVADPGIFERFDRVYETGEAWVGPETPIRYDRDGTGVQDTWFDLHFEPVRDATGRVVAILNFALDVTEQVRVRRDMERLLGESESARREAEAAREESDAARLAAERVETQFHTLADAIPTLAWTAKADGYIDWYNARWYEYTGTTPEQMEGWGWQSVHDPASLSTVLDRWRASIATGEPFEMTFPLRGADGQFRSFLTRIVPVRDTDGHVTRWFGTNTDVEPEARLRREAEAANRAKSDFLAIMSHELRTPLNAIDGYAELMELGIRGPLTDEQRQDLARIRKSQRHLLGLINDVLNYTRVEASAVRYEIEEVPLDETLATCEALTAPQRRAKGLAFQFDGCDPTLMIRADREKLQQIVLNLLTNAIKFTEPGGRVELAGASGPDGVRVTVSDTGHGIAADQLERIFEPFVQVDTRLTRTKEGVGLGLAISRDLARGMGGDLTAESTLGVGSRFTLRLPGG